MDSQMMTELLGEFIGTMILVLLGDGVVAGNVLKKTKSEGTGWLLITFGWGLAVTIAVFASGYLSPAHLNPAVTLGMAIAGETPWSAVIPYILSQIAGGIAGAILANRTSMKQKILNLSWLSSQLGRQFVIQFLI